MPVTKMHENEAKDVKARVDRTRASYRVNTGRDEKRYLVYNRTDKVLAHPTFMTLEEAEEFIRRFPVRFRHQGYYFTASQERIPAQSVDLVVVDEHLQPVWAEKR